MTKAAMLKKAFGFSSGNMDHMGLNEYQNNTGWNSWNALGPMGHGFPAGGMQNAFGSNPYATQPNIQGNEAIMQSQQQLNNMNMLEQQHPQLNNYIKGAAQNKEAKYTGLGAMVGGAGGAGLAALLSVIANKDNIDHDALGTSFGSDAAYLSGLAHNAIGGGSQGLPGHLVGGGGIGAGIGGAIGRWMDMKDEDKEEKRSAFKRAAQNNEKTQRSATGEDNGVSYKLRNEDHATGSDAWESLSKFMKTGGALSQALSAGLPLAAGGLAGTALPYLFDHKPSPEAVLGSMAGGTALGGLAMYLKGQSGAKKQRKQLKSKKQEELTEQELRDLAVLDDLAAPALKEAGFTDFQAGFYGALVDTGVDARLMKEAADKAAEQLGPELCAELYDVDFSVMEKLAVRGPAAVAEGITDFMTNSATRRASRKPLPGPTNWGKGQADAIQDLGARNQAPFVPASAPVPQGTQLTLPGFDAPKPQASVPTKPAPASDVSKPSPAPKKPGMSAKEKATVGAAVTAPTVVGGGLAALNSGGGDAGPAGATGTDGGATGTATNTAGGTGAPSKPSVYSETMDGALGDWGGIGKGINEVSNTLGADFLIDKILGEGQAAQMHPLLKVLLLAGGGMGIGGLLSGNNKMGLGGLGLAALPLLFQGTKGFGMMGGNKAAPDIDTSQVSYNPNETLDNAWSDNIISPAELAELSKDPANFSSAIAHDDFGAMAQQIIDQTATRGPQGNWAAPKENKTVGDQLLGLAGADTSLDSFGARVAGVEKADIINALTKPQGESTSLAGGFGGEVPGMGLSPEQATMLYNKLQGMQAGARPTSPVANRRTLPPDNLPPVKKQPNQNNTNMINNTGL